MSSAPQKIDGQTALSQLTELAKDEQALTLLRQQDLLRYRQLHEQVVQYLNDQIMAGDQNAEPTWTAVYERLASLFVTRDTSALLQLVDDAKPLPLQSLPAQHVRQYFQGIAYLRQAQHTDALTAFDDLLTMPDLDLTLQARILNAKAVIFRVIGRLEEAMAGYRASLELWQTLGDVHYQGIVNLNLGIISYNLHRYEQAESYLKQAESFFQTAGSGDWLAKTQSELGLVQRDLGNWDQAATYFDAYIDHSQQRAAEEDIAAGEINRAEVLLFKGAITEAKTALKQALPKLVSRTYQTDPLLYLGLAYQAEGDLAQAELYFQKALTLALDIDRREMLPHLYYHLGDVARRLNRVEETLAYWQQAAAIIQEAHTPLRDESIKISLLGRWQQVYEALILYCAAQGETAVAFEWAERARARAFAEGLADDEERPSATSIISLAALQASIPENTLLLDYFTTGVLEQDIPLLRAIPRDNPLREHILTPAQTLLFVISRTEAALYECPLNPNLFATHSPRGFDAKRFLKTAVRQRLFTDLLKPVTNYQLPDTHLVIIPHGPLHRVPFTALLAQMEPTPTLSFAPSGTIFIQQQEKRSEQADSTAVACLAVGTNSTMLKYAKAEANAVAQTMAGRAWVDDKPKKTLLQQQAATCRWLHIACHGWFDNVDPLASYLQTGIEERLTAREVLETWQLQAELVTLSACETGISQILRGDEPMGLVRAFLYAGAQSVLVSQWPVDDLATFLLMTRFYEELRAGPGKLNRSLAKAQSWLREATAVTIQPMMQQHGLPIPENDWTPETTPFSEPAYWSGFVLIGGP